MCSLKLSIRLKLSLDALILQKGQRLGVGTGAWRLFRLLPCQPRLIAHPGVSSRSPSRLPSAGYIYRCISCSGARRLGAYVVRCRIRFSFNVYCLPHPSNGHIYLFRSDSVRDDDNCSILSGFGSLFFWIFFCKEVDGRFTKLEFKSPLLCVWVLVVAGDGGGGDGASLGDIRDDHSTRSRVPSNVWGRVTFKDCRSGDLGPVGRM